MLFLISDNGKLVNRWLVVKDKSPSLEEARLAFPDIQVICPALIDSQGAIIHGDCIDLVNNQPVLSEQKKAAYLAEIARVEAEQLAAMNAEAAIQSIAKKSGKLSSDEMEQLIRLLARTVWG